MSSRYHRACRAAVALGCLLTALPIHTLASPLSGTVVVGSHTFTHHGLVGVGRIPAATKDKFGETFGSLSAFAFQPGSWQRHADGSYSGILLTQPDRGYNIDHTTNYTPRFNRIAVRFHPAPDGAATQDQLDLTLVDTVKFTDPNGTPFTSLDPTSEGTGQRPGFPPLPEAPNHRLSLDPEGIAINADGSLWVSDEYGPYLYQFSPRGQLLAALRPPEAFIPKRNGADSFASNNPGVGQPAPVPVDPTTGRQNNQGLEGLSLTPDGRTLYALLQSATRQDGGAGGSSLTRLNTRLLAYDISGATPALKGEYVLQLPTYPHGSKTRVAAQSDMLAINDTQLLVIARDGNGLGAEKATSVYRTILIYDLSDATNLAHTAYDSATTPVAPNGVLTTGIIPASRTAFIDLNAPDQLAKFGLHNGPTNDVNNLAEKWEALALVPALDTAAPDDYFLFVGNDNDFLTTAGFQDGAAYSGALDNDTIILVYRVTLPGRR